MGKALLSFFLFFLHISLFAQITTSGINGRRITESDNELIAGSNNKYKTFQLDGIVSNDVFGLSDSTNPISLDVIEDYRS